MKPHTCLFAVIYRGFVYPEKEVEYVELWGEIARYFIEHCGAIGSTLHKIGTCEYLAYSKWPSRSMRDASWENNAQNLPHNITTLIQQLKTCIDRAKPYEETGMDVVDSICKP